MIFQMYKTLTEYMNTTNSSGLLVPFLYANYIWPGTTPLLLFCLGIIITIGVYLGQKATTGDGNLIISSTVAMTFLFFISTIMALKKGLIDPYTYGIVFTLWIVSIVILFTSRDKYS